VTNVTDTSKNSKVRRRFVQRFIMILISKILGCGKHQGRITQFYRPPASLIHKWNKSFCSKIIVQTQTKIQLLYRPNQPPSQPSYGTSFFRNHPGEPVPEENFWTLWCKGRLTEADTSTIRLGATPSGLNSAHLHHPFQFFYRPDALPAAQRTVSKHWRQLVNSD